MCTTVQSPCKGLCKGHRTSAHHVFLSLISDKNDFKHLPSCFNDKIVQVFLVETESDLTNFGDLSAFGPYQYLIAYLVSKVVNIKDKSFYSPGLKGPLGASIVCPFVCHLRLLSAIFKVWVVIQLSNLGCKFIFRLLTLH